MTNRFAWLGVLCLALSGFSDDSCTARAYRDYQDAVQSCGGGSSSSEEWNCDTVVENKSGTLDISRCKGNLNYACYEDIKETCRESHSGRVTTKKYTQYTGRCTSGFSECW